MRQSLFTATSTKSLTLKQYTIAADTKSNANADRMAAGSPVTGASRATIATSPKMNAQKRSMNITNPQATSPKSKERRLTNVSL